MQKITINNIKVFGYHGVYDKERDEGQYFYVNIIYSYDYDYPNDDIRNVKDYTKKEEKHVMKMQFKELKH